MYEGWSMLKEDTCDAVDEINRGQKENECVLMDFGENIFHSFFIDTELNENVRKHDS